MRYSIPDGYSFEYVHEQFAKPITIRWNNRDITPCGYTRAFLKTKEGLIVAEAIAWCRDNDQFSKKIGRLVSSGRALRNFHKGEAMQTLGPNVIIT